jgi:hypothetical protein
MFAMDIERSKGLDSRVYEASSAWYYSDSCAETLWGFGEFCSQPNGISAPKNVRTFWCDNLPPVQFLLTL